MPGPEWSGRRWSSRPFVRQRPAMPHQPLSRSEPACPAAERLTLWLLDRDGQMVAILEETGDHRSVAIPLAALARALAITGATHIFMAHDHPSGDPRPSMADIATTRQVWRLARTLGASLQDHVVTGGGRQFSFRAHGLL